MEFLLFCEKDKESASFNLPFLLAIEVGKDYVIPQKGAPLPPFVVVHMSLLERFRLSTGFERTQGLMFLCSTKEC